MYSNCHATCNDISEIIDAGLGQIPSTSRLYEAVNKIKNIILENNRWVEIWNNVFMQYAYR